MKTDNEWNKDILKRIIAPCQANKSLIYQTTNFISKYETYPSCPPSIQGVLWSVRVKWFLIDHHLPDYKKHYNEKTSEVAEAIRICEDTLPYPASLGRAFPCPRKTEPLWEHLHPLFPSTPPQTPLQRAGSWHCSASSKSHVTDWQSVRAKSLRVLEYLCINPAPPHLSLTGNTK